VFSPFGEIVQIDVKRDKITHNNLGYGFVEFKTRAQAQRALKELNGIGETLFAVTRIRCALGSAFPRTAVLPFHWLCSRCRDRRSPSSHWLGAEKHDFIGEPCR
jgi:RNA recognition motif-containing protein